jgi:hypothetical protein
MVHLLPKTEKVDKEKAKVDQGKDRDEAKTKVDKKND